MSWCYNKITLFNFYYFILVVIQFLSQCLSGPNLHLIKKNMMKRRMKIESSNHKIMDKELLGHLHSKEQFATV